MELDAVIDAYCERLDPSFWAEPLNAVTNSAFLLAAAFMAIRLRDARLPLAWGLVGLLAAIGIGSFLFHTFATAWAALSDVIPIALFILVYLFALNRDVWRWPFWTAFLGTVAFLPYAALVTPFFNALPFFEVSAIYWSVPLALLIYAALLRSRTAEIARGMVIGAGILMLSLTARSLDMPLCAALPFGTHFLWHLLNAVMLAWMIEIYRRHMLAAQQRQG
ncbi:ceramidase domain-containing protein [Fontisubflavum oceani]|uniref:ceramidase domain-containing protein n=1 Tax=Fontisubflavum oceani TaxID=2978973 RepID=UPI0025B361D1|nr:ceramidase domain-containing protein [Fontisubflavum oceani]WJY21630.1 ceramidase domain-containing protein [Fontisubflavum oceani]